MHTDLPGLLIILDGLGDHPVSEFGGLTPLEAAHTPHLDTLARNGLTGLADPIAPGVTVSTEVGVGVLMGLTPPHGIPARGVVEAVGVGLELTGADLAWRCNLATVRRDKSGWTLLDRRAGRISGADSQALTETLDRELGTFDGASVRVRAGTGHRLALVLRGPDLSAALTDMDPGSGGEGGPIPPCRPLQPSDTAAERTAGRLNAVVRAAHGLLDGHPVNRRRRSLGFPPANIILPRKPGRIEPGHPPSGLLNRLGVRTAVVAGERTVIGLGRLLGMRCITDARFTGLARTDLPGKVAAVLNHAAGNQLLILHVKAPDLLAHDHDPGGKRAAIEAIDLALAPLLDCSRRVVAVTADHATSCRTGRHCGDPVPVLLAAPGGPRDGVAAFGETACRSGGLGRITNTALLRALLERMGRAPPVHP